MQYIVAQHIQRLHHGQACTLISSSSYKLEVSANITLNATENLAVKAIQEKCLKTMK